MAIALQLPHLSHGPWWLGLNVQEPAGSGMRTAVWRRVARPPSLQQQLSSELSISSPGAYACLRPWRLWRSSDWSAHVLLTLSSSLEAVALGEEVPTMSWELLAWDKTSVLRSQEGLAPQLLGAWRRSSSDQPWLLSPPTQPSACLETRAWSPQIVPVMSPGSYSQFCSH